MFPQIAARNQPASSRTARNAPSPARLIASGANADLLAQRITFMGATMSYARNTEIFGENEPADYLYKVVKGTVRTYKVLNDGRRRSAASICPAIFCGLEFFDEYTLSADAITDVLVARRSALATLAERDAAIGRERHALSERELRRVQERILPLIKSARERVASFLLEMAKRATTADAIELPVSRQDIGDYLGLTIETVSRTLFALESAAAIEVPTSRRIMLHNRPALNRLHR